jgi:hypothetical protein
VTRSNPSEAWDVTGGASATSNGTPNECLDVTNRSTANGTQLQQWACTAGDPAQTFQLVPES